MKYFMTYARMRQRAEEEVVLLTTCEMVYRSGTCCGGRICVGKAR